MSNFQTNLPKNSFDLTDLIEAYFVKNIKEEETFKIIYITMSRTLIPKFKSMLTTSVITAEDIYNETWFAILNPETAAYDSEKGAFIGYFYSIAKNKIYNWNFKKETTDTINIDEVKEDLLRKMEPNRELFDKELKVLFYQEINKLPAAMREIIMFRNLGYQYSEIAEMMGVNETALRQRMASAKNILKLKKELIDTIF